MKDFDSKTFSGKTISLFGRRSDGAVMLITLLFAMGGAVLALFTQGKGIWGIWIPLCFMTIPPIHFLCRKVQELKSRLDEMENRISHSKTIETDG